MALIGNRSVLHKSPGRFLSGTVASIERSNFCKAGMLAGRFQSLSRIFAGLPSGHLPPSSWSMPRTAGAMSSINSAGMSLSAGGLAVGGVTSPGSASFTISMPDATGSLIASGAGSASMVLTAAGSMTGIISGAGSSSFTINTNTPLLGAIAGGSGSASMSLTATGTMLPADDTPPARTASATFSITASAIATALGHMEGSTAGGGDVLTADEVAIATVAALQSTTIPVNVERVHGVQLQGTGVLGDSMRPA